MKEGARRVRVREGDVMVEQEVAERETEDREEKGEAVEGGGLKMLVLKMEQAMGAASRSWKAHR